MSEKRNGVNHSMRVPVRNRRANTLDRLVAQLEAGVKTNQGVEKPLTEKDVKRINSEIGILKKRI
jgi:hypothetical protein